jgi:hypothetical protein
MKKKNLKKLFIIPTRLIYLIFIAIIKSITIDLVKNIKLAYIFSFKPKERDKINREVNMKKLAQSFDGRLETVERLLYSLIEDAEYLKTKKGKLDIDDLKDKVK